MLLLLPSKQLSLGGIITVTQEGEYSSSNSPHPPKAACGNSLRILPLLGYKASARGRDSQYVSNLTKEKN